MLKALQKNQIQFNLIIIMPPKAAPSNFALWTCTFFLYTLREI